MLSISEIEEIIQKIRAAIEELKNIWSNTLNNSVSKIENSWAGEDAKVYTDKVQALDPQVQKICQAMELLAQTYQKVLDRSNDKTLIVKEAISRVTF